MKLPNHKLIIGPKQESSGFLKTNSQKVTFLYENGISSSMTMDSVERKSLDVVVIMPYYVGYHDKHGDNIIIYLRSCIRPALVCRDYKSTERFESDNIHNMWEFSAGLIELEETGIDGIKSAASRELEEEVGFTVESNKFNQLGKRVFGSVGMMGERLYYLIVEIDPLAQKTPIEDGSPLEKFAKVERVSLDTAFMMMKSGEIYDTKTIIGLYKLKEYFSQ